MPLPDDLKYSSKQQHGLRPLFSAHISALDMTSSPHKGLLNSNRQPVNGSTGWVGFLTLGAGEAATRTSHLPFPAALSPRRGWVPSAAKQQKVPGSQGYFWDSWKLVPGPGLQELGESGLWWFCSVCRSRISSELHTPSPPSSHQLESTTGKGGNTEKGDMQGGWVKTPGPEDGRYTDPPQDPLPRAPPSKVQLSLTPDIILAAPTVGVSLPLPWIFCREVPTRRVWVTLLNGIWPRCLLPQPLCTHHGDQSFGLSRR